MEPKTELERNAINKARRKELDTFQRALDIQWLNSRMEGGGMGRCLALIQREADMEKDFKERTDHTAIVNEQATKETNLGIEVAKVRREEACGLLRRHYIRERDPSLRELQRKLQAGYVCRDQRLQIQNNVFKRLQDKAEEKQANTVLLNSLFNIQGDVGLEDRKKMERNTLYRKDLQQQLVEREQVRRCTYEDTLIEKKMLEDVMRTLADEDQKELANKRETIIRLRDEMKTFSQARQAWKEKQKQKVVNEEREIEKQLAAASDRSAAIVAERERKLREKQELVDRISAEILADEAARQEREDIIKMLQEQEYLEMNANEDLGEKTKLDRMKKETKEALTEQMEIKKRLAREYKEREVAFRLETEAKMVAGKDTEQDLLLKKREKARLYSSQLQDQIRQDAARKDAAAREEQARAQYVWDCDKAWRAEVSSERQEIVRSHAPGLLGYLQAGVLQPEDLPTVAQGAALNPALAALDVDAMLSTARPQRFPKCNAKCRVLREY